MSSSTFAQKRSKRRKSTEKFWRLFWVICWEMILIDLLETGIAMGNPPIEDVFSSDNGDFPISC